MVKDITVVETNYTDYALVLKHKVFHREYTQVALYGKTHHAQMSDFSNKLVNMSQHVLMFCVSGPVCRSFSNRESKCDSEV